MRDRGPGSRPRARAAEGPVVAIACLGAAVMTAGVQGIAPAIPAIQSQFSLDAAQVALITSVYLFPSMFSAFGSGVLADRFGSRPVFAVSLLIFGVGGAFLLVEHSLAAVLIVRLVQGAAFGAVLSLSVAIIGDVASSTRAAAKGQSRRVVSISAFESILPMAGGVLVAFAWYAPFAMQLLALPCAVAAWLVLPTGTGGRDGPAPAGTRAVLSAPAVLSVQMLGALRFVLKFAVLTYFPVLAVSLLGMSAAQVGLVMGVSAFLTAVAAWSTQRLVARWLSSQLIAGCLVTGMVSLAALGAAGLMDGDLLTVAAAALLVFGLQDGVYGVAHNVLIAELAPPGARSSYVGLSGTVRNVGKFAAPMIFGAATVVLSIPHSFLALAAVSLASVASARRVIRVEVGRRRERPVPDP